jgi:hypothetical protein
VLIAITVLLWPVTDELLTTPAHIVRLLASDVCTTYDYCIHAVEFAIGLLTALGGAFSSDSKATKFLVILTGTGLMVLACVQFAHCGIH